MRILVTGGAGFLGSHLCDLLLSQGHEVICLDNLYSGQMDNIEHLRSNPKFEFIEKDVIEPVSLTGLDRIYHLACPASPFFYQADPIYTVQTNVRGTLNMLDLALINNARILLASTSEVYGNPSIHPQTESYWGNVNPVGIRSCYDEGKRCAETLCFDYHRQENIEIRVARIFNSYGPRMMENDGRVISNFIVQALKGIDITIFGEGKQTRSFCYGLDTIRGLNALMEGDEIGPVNIGNPVENTILELAEFVIRKIPETKSKIVFKPLPSDDPERRLPDITLARTKLNWQPHTPLDDGLEQTINYFRERFAKEPLPESPYERLNRRIASGLHKRSRIITKPESE